MIRFETIEEAQAFAYEIFYSKAWKNIIDPKNSPNSMTVEYNSRQTYYAGMAYYNRVVLTAAGMTNFTLIHEMAHIAGYRHHDFGFRVAHVKLVEKFIGKEEAKLLKQCYKDQGLKMSTRIAKDTSFESWYKNYNKMEKVRAARKAA